MNNSQVKGKLLQIQAPREDFSVVMSGKTSRKIDGLYKSKSREIIIHNKNFSHDDELMYTAIHEFAHHIHFTTSPTPISSRSHTTQFWSIFHSLLDRAEGLGIYHSIFAVHADFRDLTRRIKQELLAQNGSLMIELGALLRQAIALCDKHHVSFEDYLDRILNLPKPSARVMMAAHQMELDPKVGYENMRVLTRIKEPEQREAAQEALLNGQSTDTVKQKFLSRKEDKSRLEVLLHEKKRIEHTIQSLEARLSELNKRIAATEEEIGH